MMIVHALWREAARFRTALSASVGLLVLVFLTHVAQAVAIAWSLSAVLGGRPEDVLLAICVLVAIALLRLALSLAQTSAAARLGGEVRQAVRRRAMAAALVPQRLHDTGTRDGSIRSSLSDGVNGTDAYVSKYIPAVVQIFLTCPFVVLMLLSLSPTAGLLVAAALLFALLGPMAWKRMMARRGLDHWDSYDALSADLLESLRGMATLRALGDVPATRTRLTTRSEALRRATERVMRGSLAETAVTDLAVQAGVVAAAIAATAHAVTGQAPGLEVYLILLLASEAFRPVRDLSQHWHAGFLGLTAVPALERLGAFTERPDTTATAHPDSDERPAREATGNTLSVTGLSFRYPGAPRPVLEDFACTAQRGTLTAVVGPSGAGKSTLFDLLLGLLTPQAGRMELDGRPLRPSDIAVLSQLPVLFAGTVRDNLTLNSEPADTELVDACASAGILSEIRSLPLGFDSEVAEAGSNLSGGQRQRLALARALLAKRPVLLVDEPTSALDAARAAEVVDTLHRVASERIVVMISHRPESLTEVSHIVRLGTEQWNRTHS